MNLTGSPHDFLLILVPAIIAYINRPAWSPLVKWLVALAVCFVASFVELWATQGMQMVDISGVLARVLAIMGTYAMLYKSPTLAFFDSLGNKTLSDYIESRFNAGA